MSAIEVKLVPVTTIAAPSLVRFESGHDKESLAQLAASIKKHGLLQPIVIRPATEDHKPSEWVIVAGRRRLAAFKLAQLDEIPALISGTDEAQAYEAEAAENLQREDMSLAEKATYVRTLMAVYNNAKTVCEIVNKSPAWVSKMLSITDSRNPPEIADLLDRGLVQDLETLVLLKQIATMPASHPKAAATLTRMLKLASEGNLSRAIARDALADLKDPRPAPAPTAGVSRLTTSQTIAPPLDEQPRDPKAKILVGVSSRMYDMLVAVADALDVDTNAALEKLIQTAFDNVPPKK